MAWVLVCDECGTDEDVVEYEEGDFCGVCLQMILDAEEG